MEDTNKKVKWDDEKNILIAEEGLDNDLINKISTLIKIKSVIYGYKPQQIIGLENGIKQRDLMSCHGSIIRIIMRNHVIYSFKIGEYLNIDKKATRAALACSQKYNSDEEYLLAVKSCFIERIEKHRRTLDRFIEHYPELRKTTYVIGGAKNESNLLDVPIVKDSMLPSPHDFALDNKDYDFNLFCEYLNQATEKAKKLFSKVKVNKYQRQEMDIDCAHTNIISQSYGPTVSLSSIGKKFGGLHHATIIFKKKRHSKFIVENNQYRYIFYLISKYFINMLPRGIEGVDRAVPLRSVFKKLSDIRKNNIDLVDSTKSTEKILTMHVLSNAKFAPGFIEDFFEKNGIDLKIEW